MFILISALMLPFTLNAQTDDRNTQGADREGSALNPQTKARVRTEGSVGGLEDQGGGRIHDETSSDREEGRGARGLIR